MLRIPRSTYRLQLHKEFTFDDAAEIAVYLRSLGISHVYSSPYLQAAPGSMHGYDVVDHQRVNEELGGAEAHERFCKKLGEVDLGQVLGVTPLDYPSAAAPGTQAVVLQQHGFIERQLSLSHSADETRNEALVPTPPPTPVTVPNIPTMAAPPMVAASRRVISAFMNSSIGCSLRCLRP